ncbi:gliding motility protein GldL [Flavobacteriales bacterium]|nr:gliding motility protein GldL [bacterium]MDB2539018.1 gliding motility protein GldL [Flavobacteriales bacterium]
MSSGDSFFESTKFKTIMKYVYGYGGAIVIIGAMFKIQHWPGATIMLIGGLGIEAVIFMLSAHEPLHEELDWTIAYPELALGHSSDDHSPNELPDLNNESKNESVVEQLDNMLAKAKIEPELIKSLGDGMKNLSDNAGKLGDISSASDATNDYVNNLKGASTKVGELSNAYDQAANSIKEITSISSGDSNFGDQLDKVSGNLTQLNNLYEMQLEGVTALSKASEDMTSGISNIVNNLQSSVDDTKKYKETMSDLTSNLAALNSVYGNMLSAMNVNK